MDVIKQETILLRFPQKSGIFISTERSLSTRSSDLEFTCYRMNHKLSHFIFMSLWAFFLIKVLEYSSKISISQQCWLILLPNVPDWRRSNLYTFLHPLDLGSTSIGEWLGQENNSLIITLDLVNMRKLQIICIIFLQSKFQPNVSHRI